MISIVVAKSKNNIIGADGGLPWTIPEDLKKFKEITMGKPIIMGRATYDSIGSPLPGRLNIIISRNRDIKYEGCVVTDCLSNAVTIAQLSNEHKQTKEVCIIGGGEVFRQAIDWADNLYISEVNVEVDGDTFFPEINELRWHEQSRTKFKDFDFVKYRRI